MWAAVMELLMHGQLSDGSRAQEAPAFALAAGLMGVGVVVLDLLMFTLKGRSFLGLAYGGTKTVWLLALWGVAAMIGGYLGMAFQIFQLNRAGCIVAGASWPLVLPRLIDAGIPSDVQKPTVEQKE